MYSRAGDEEETQISVILGEDTPELNTKGRPPPRTRDIGGPYGESEDEEDDRPPPRWVKWWLREQAKMMQDLARARERTPGRGEEKRQVEPHHFKLTKMSGEDDPEAYIHAFERMALTARWPKEQWSVILTPYLTGPAQLAVEALPPYEVRDYQRVKQAILSTLKISGESYRRRMRTLEYSKERGGRLLANLIRAHGMRWLRPTERSTEEIVEVIWLEKFLDTIPKEAEKWVRSHNPKTLDEAVELLEAFEGAEEAGERRFSSLTDRRRGGVPEVPLGRRREAPQISPIGRGRPNEGGSKMAEGGARPKREREEERPAGTSEESMRRRERPWYQPGGLVCFKCGIRGHVRRECPYPERPRDAAYSQEQVPYPRPLTCKVKINGKEGTALIDSGCSQTLVKEGWVPRKTNGPGVLIKCVHGDVKGYPAGEANVEVQGQEYRMKVGIAPRLPYEIVLGRDWPAFGDLVSKRKEAVTCVGEGREVTPGIPQEQREDPTLKYAWEQANSSERVGVQSPRFIVRQGVLYRVGKESQGEAAVDQLVVPRGRRQEILSMAHDCPMGGHMGEASTLARILLRFYWPGVYKEVQKYCSSCKQCQLTQDKGRPGGQLKPLPIIGVPFERVGLDLVGPLPKGRGGYQYIMVLVDYATRYPEAVPLRSTKAPVLAKELLKIFARVGIPSEVLTDQGTNLMGEVMSELWKQLGVRHLHTSVYHPQCNGLVERFNQTLKRLLRKFAVDDPTGWPQVLDLLLFAVREVPQASTGYSPFELLFGRKPRGVLDLTREEWEKEAGMAKLGRKENLGQLRSKLRLLAKWAGDNLRAAQIIQEARYNKKVTPREFQVEEKVLVLLPTSESKLLARWQGPYTIKRKLSEVDYEVETPGKALGSKIYHVNLLKAWKEREDESLLGEREFGPEVPRGRDQVTKIPVGEALNSLQRADVQRLQDDFQEVFSKKPGKTNLVEHKITLKESKTVRLAPRRWPRHLEDQLTKEVREMERLGVIEPSGSEWRSYPVLVPKPDGTIRVCIDFRKVNEASKFDAYPMPRVQGLLERLGKARYLTTLDMTKGYWQIPLEERSKEYTAFSTPLGLYQFTRMPFGLHGAAATFQRLVDKLLRRHTSYAAAYIDDVVVYSSSWQEHVQHLRAVLEEVRGAGLTINPDKCQVGKEDLQFLGFQVGKGQVKPVLDKVHAIAEVPVPQNRKEIQRFLGMVGYYRSFIPQFSEVAAPLTDLLRGKRIKGWQWGKGCQDAFEKLKEALCTSPVLRAPDFTKPFKVLTDASARGMGAVLAQDFEGQEHPIFYLSKKFSAAETKYATIEREALAVKWALETLRYYLLGAPFTLITDHAPLTWLHRMKDSNARLTRWYLALQPFKFDIVHRKGTLMTNADFLSRQAVQGPSGQEDPAAPVLAGEACHIDWDAYERFNMEPMGVYMGESPRVWERPNYPPLDIKLFPDSVEVWTMQDMVDLWRTGGRGGPKRRGITVGPSTRWYAPGGVASLEGIWRENMGGGVVDIRERLGEGEEEYEREELPWRRKDSEGAEKEASMDLSLRSLSLKEEGGGGLEAGGETQAAGAGRVSCRRRVQKKTGPERERETE